METITDIDKFVKDVSETLLGGMIVYYDLDKMKYEKISRNWLDEYGEFLDSDDEPKRDYGFELQDWEVELIKDVRQAENLPDSIEAPPSWVQFKWRERFVEDHRDNLPFAKAAAKALYGKHPFHAFKSALYNHEIISEWYPYEIKKMEEYVRDEMGIE